MSQSLSIVIPAYNEALHISDSLDEIIRFARGYCGETEIIVVDDGSKDETVALFKSAQSALDTDGPELKLVQHDRNRGKGAAVRTGFENATGEVVMFTDVDLSAPISEAPRIIEPIVRGDCDIAIGSRGVDPSMIKMRQNVFRQTAGRTFNRMVRLLTGLNIQDTQCGFKAFRRSAAAPVFAMQRIDGFAFDVEILYIASKLGLSIVELPVRWSHVEHSKVSMLHDTRRMALDVCRIRWNDLRGLYRTGH